VIPCSLKRIHTTSTGGALLVERTPILFTSLLLNSSLFFVSLRLSSPVQLSLYDAKHVDQENDYLRKEKPNERNERNQSAESTKYS